MSFLKTHKLRAAITLCLLSAALFIPNFLFAQHNHTHNGRNCHAMDVLDRQVQQDPDREIRMMEIERFTEQYLRQMQSSGLRNTDCREIPVVVTVVYSNSQQNISQAQIESQITVLNEDFAGTNADFNPPSEFAGVAPGNTGITFTLQNVRRYSNSRSTWGTSDAVKAAYPPVSPSTTLNMWVCNIGGGILGYAQFPGGSSSTDGVVMSPQYFGSSDLGNNFYLSAPFDKGRTTTHEVGHYLNLRHIWGDGNCNVDDGVGDTPRQGGPSSGCPSYPRNTCSQAGNDMTMNYMDYSNDDCMFMFSQGQADRMWACLNGPRANLGSACSSGGGGTGGGGSTNCYDGAITFDLTTDNYGSETSWTVEDGNGNVVESGSGYANNTNYTVNWNLADGNYTFTINDSYGDGICCSYGNGSYSLNAGSDNIGSGGSFTSSESVSFCVQNATSGGGGGGTGGGGTSTCTTLDLNTYTIKSYGGNQDNGTSNVTNDYLVLNGNAWKYIDLNYTVTSNTVIEFQFGSLTEGEIQGIGFDNDNGISDNRTFRLYGTQNWGINNYDNYATSAGSWKTYTIPVGQFYTGTFDRLFFACDQDQGSGANAYFRNIKIYEGSCSGARGTVEDVTSIDISHEGEGEEAFAAVHLFPNPAKDLINVQVTAEATNIQGQIMDATGRMIWNGQLNKGVNPINISELPAGMYHFSTMLPNGTMITRKFVKMN